MLKLAQFSCNIQQVVAPSLVSLHYQGNLISTLGRNFSDQKSKEISQNQDESKSDAPKQQVKEQQILSQEQKHIKKELPKDNIPTQEQQQEKKKSQSKFGMLGVGGVAGIAGVGCLALYFGLSTQFSTGKTTTPEEAVEVKVGDYGAVREAIAGLLEDENYDDGSYGPLLVRLAWHCAGTYDKKTNTGGSDGARMRYSPERDDPANNGLNIARKLLEPIKQKFSWITYADLYTLSGVVAIEEMGGPTIPWRSGRTDVAQPPPQTVDSKEYKVVSEGRLPDGAKDQRHLRHVFQRMGFNDQEIVALSGAHTLGRCHLDRSGWVNRWTNAPTAFSNLYFQELMKTTQWKKKQWEGPIQYEDPSGELMMLPTDMALVWDRKFKKYVELYANDEQKFFQDFASAFSKLLELGVVFSDAAVPTTQ